MTQKVVDTIQRKAPGRIISRRATTQAAIMDLAPQARVTAITRRVRATAITLRVNPCSEDSLKKPFLASLAVD